MKRVQLTDGSGRWFDKEKAQHYSDSTYFDGSNHIHRTTGDQWSGQDLYKTASGKWILECWSSYQNVPPKYVEIDHSEAIDWLAANNHYDSLPTDIVAELEV